MNPISSVRLSLANSFTSAALQNIRGTRHEWNSSTPLYRTVVMIMLDVKRVVCGNCVARSVRCGGWTEELVEGGCCSSVLSARILPSLTGWIRGCQRWRRMNGGKWSDDGSGSGSGSVQDTVMDA